jgi:tRNA-2-methylthio-N6-dimethylallyladenosine synthase
MRRTYDRDRYLRLVDRLRSAIPDLALGTDLIVGFPGETDDDFAQTVSLVEEVGFDSAFTFIFSPRSGTTAAELPDPVPDDLKHTRLEELVAVVQRVGADRNAARVGRVEEVLVEGPSRTDPALSVGGRVEYDGRARRRRAGRGARGRARGALDATTLRGRVASLVAAA